MSNEDRLPRGAKRPDDAIEPTDALLYGNMSEKEFQARVEGVFREVGFKVYHTYRSKKSEPGFPDFIAIRVGIRGALQIVAELKTEKARPPTAEQIEWLNAYAMLPGTWTFLWRPSDMSEIQTVAKCAYEYTEGRFAVIGRMPGSWGTDGTPLEITTAWFTP